MWIMMIKVDVPVVETRWKGCKGVQKVDTVAVE